MSLRSPFTRSRRSARQGRSALARVVSGLWMLLYVGIVAGAPVADGFVDHGEAVVVHVEDADGGHCPASHGAESCEICQLAHGLRAISAPVAVDLPQVADAGSVAFRARGIAPVELHFLDGRSSRAPPLG